MKDTSEMTDEELEAYVNELQSGEMFRRGPHDAVRE